MTNPKYTHAPPTGGHIKSRLENGKNHPVLSVWNNMKRRCRIDSKFVSYRDTKVCKDWQSFSEFANWYIDYRSIYDESYWEDLQIDKDIIGDGSIYSPEACILVPSALNKFFARINGVKGYHIDSRYGNISICPCGFGKRVEEFGFGSTLDAVIRHWELKIFIFKEEVESGRLDCVPKYIIDKSSNKLRIEANKAIALAEVDNQIVVKRRDRKSKRHNTKIGDIV